MADIPLNAVITAKDEASAKLKAFGKAADAVGDSLKRIGAAAVVGLGALAYGLKSCIDEASEAQRGIAQTNAVLKSTGGVAGVTAEQVTKLADSLSMASLFTDDMVRSAENEILTYTSISKDAFPRATQAIIDMATALEMDLSSATKTVSIALQNPIEGIGRLKKIGVNFTNSQKDLVKAMLDVGDMAGAQAFILQELETEYGGSGLAAAKTFAGAIHRISQGFDNLKETLGKAIIEGIAPFVEKLAEWASSEQVQKKIQDIAKALGDVIIKIGEFIGKIVEFVEKNPEFSKNLLLFVGILIGLNTLHIPQLVTAIGILMGGGGFAGLAGAVGGTAGAMSGIIGLIIAGTLLDIALIFQVKDAWKGLQSDIDGLKNTTIPGLNTQLDFAKQKMDTATSPEQRAKWKGIYDDTLKLRNETQELSTRYEGIPGFVRAIADEHDDAIKRMKAGQSKWTDFFFLAFINPLDTAIAAAKTLIEKLGLAIEKQQKLNTEKAIKSSENMPAVNDVLRDSGLPTVLLKDSPLKPKKALGGPVSSNTSYMVGEVGPELFVPSSAGRIIPNNQITNNQGITINFYGNITNTSQASLDEIGKGLARQLELARYGVS